MKNNIIKWLAGSVATLAIASTAHATISEAVRVSLDNGATWTTANGVDDAGSMVATFALANGTFSVAVNASGFNPPTVGTAASPVIDLGVNGTMTPGSVIVEYSVTGFTPVPTGSIITGIAPAGIGAYSETETTRIGTAALFSSTAVFGTISANRGGTASSSGFAPSGTSDPYSITIQEVLHTDARGVVLSTDDTLSVPDGGSTMMLLGSALSALGLIKSRGFRKSAVKA